MQPYPRDRSPAGAASTRAAPARAAPARAAKVCSAAEAKLAFDAFARIEPKLAPLWDDCRRARLPASRADNSDDAYDVDLYDADALLADDATAGWCTEDYFLRAVKPQLVTLVGAHRADGPRELQDAAAYETIYDLLLDWALDRSCSCCERAHV